MNKIKLLTISPTCEIGGGDINLLRLLSRLSKDEYSITHLFPYDGPMLNEFKKSGIEVMIVDMPRARFFRNPFSYLKLVTKFIPTVFKIRSIIVSEKIDIVCTSTMANVYGCLAARLSNRPHVLIALEYLPVFRIISPYFHFFSDKIVCCSELVRSMFGKSSKTDVLPLSVDLNEFNPSVSGERIRRNLGITGQLVTMVTRIDQWKGVEVFIKAAKYVNKEVKFVVFGQALKGKEAYILRLKGLIEQEGLTGKVFVKADEYGYKDTPEIIAASDIIVHASLRPEPFGIIIVEAMAMGKPVIASKSGGPLEIISDGKDGILISSGDPGILAKEISVILENPELAKGIGLNARIKAEEDFDLIEYVKRFGGVFNNLLKTVIL